MELNDFLIHHFGYTEFRPGQREIIEAAINKKNVLGVLATGSGKTLCYQFVSEWLEGVTIVLSPLISLMEDQWTRIRQSGNKRVGILHSGLDRGQLELEWKFILNNKRKLLFISPERLNDPQTLKKLSLLKIGLLVVDEAHCISQWGYDFRPDYLLISDAYSSLGFPPIMALTGTASPKIQNDIIEKLQMNNSDKVILSMNRANIVFYKQAVTNEVQKKEFLWEQLPKLKGPGIIYASTRRQTEQLAEWLSERLQIDIPAYHAGLTNEDRTLIQSQFLTGQVSILVATSAFGMGIDKNDIRFVIHYQLPTSIESYLQEIGRVGRDGNDGIAIILYSTNDVEAAKSLISYSIPNKSVLHEIISGLQLDIGKMQFKTEIYENMPLKSIYYQLMQGGWISTNLATHDYQWNKVVSDEDLDTLMLDWEELRYQKEHTLTLFNDIMNKQICLRKELLRSLSEPDHSYTRFCCSNCGCEISYFYKNAFNLSQSEEILGLNWKDELNRLLPIHATM